MRGAVLLLLAALTAMPAAGGEVMARRTLAPGTVIAAGDLDGGDADARAAITGLEVRRAIYAGRPVTQAALGPPTVVERNAIVSMRYVSGGLSIRAEGRALDAGARGERVRVLNIDTRNTVVAVVTGPDRVSVSP